MMMKHGVTLFLTVVLIVLLCGCSDTGTNSAYETPPLGGPFLSTSEIDNISLWITQGALNN